MITTIPSTVTLVIVGWTMMVRTMSPMIRTSSPRRIARPRRSRSFWYASVRSVVCTTATA